MSVLMISSSGITLLAFFLRFIVFNFKESPKFLVHQGKDAEAAAVLEHISNVNGRKCKSDKCGEDRLELAFSLASLYDRESPLIPHRYCLTCRLSGHG